MNPAPENYAVWPSVVPADKETEITVVPQENAFLFWEDREYTVSITPVDEDLLDYHTSELDDQFPVKAAGGVLRFSYTFRREQEHVLEIYEGEKKLYRTALYSLEPDLYGLRPLKGDLHSHSYRSDGRRDPAALAGHYREQGYDFFALTDHNRYAPGGEILDAYKDVKIGLNLLRGEEVHTPGSIVHIVHVGGKESVADIYIHDPDRYEREWKAIAKDLPDTIPAQYRDRYAMAAWASESIHRAGGIAIFAHPYWRPIHTFNVCDEFNELMFKSGFYDAYELVGGMKPVGVNRSFLRWSELRAEGLKLPVVGSSDVHTLKRCEEGDISFPEHYTIALAKANTSDAVLDAVRTDRSVAVEETPGTDEVRVYGRYRFGAYVQYLLKYYFPRVKRIVEGEGVLMRRYLIGEVDGGVLSALADQSDRFYSRFFGLEPPVLPSEKTLAFEEKWREVQKKGPQTKGSHIFFYDNGRNRLQL